MSEGIVAAYFKKIITEGDPVPGKIIAKFFWELFEIAPRTQDIIMFNKLVKLFGRRIVFETVVDSYSIENLDFDKSLYPLFLYMAKKKFEKEVADIGYVDLNKYYEQVKEKIESIKANGK